MTTILNIINEMSTGSAPTTSTTASGASPKSNPRSGSSITLPSISNLTASLKTSTPTTLDAESVSRSSSRASSTSQFRPSLHSISSTLSARSSIMSLTHYPMTPSSDYKHQSVSSSHRESFGSFHLIDEHKEKNDFQLPPLSSILTDTKDNDNKATAKDDDKLQVDTEPTNSSLSSCLTVPTSTADKEFASEEKITPPTECKDYDDKPHIEQEEAEEDEEDQEEREEEDDDKMEILQLDKIQELQIDNSTVIYDPVLGKRFVGKDGRPLSTSTFKHEKRKRVVRRRTRTGCLTCRKRRIKCDERKPFCFNCEKSKKLCAGYEQVPYGSRRYRYIQQPKPQEIQMDHPIIHQGPLPSPTSTPPTRSDHAHNHNKHSPNIVKPSQLSQQQINKEAYEDGQQVRSPHIITNKSSSSQLHSIPNTQIQYPNQQDMQHQPPPPPHIQYPQPSPPQYHNQQQPSSPQQMMARPSPQNISPTLQTQLRIHNQQQQQQRYPSIPPTQQCSPMPSNIHHIQPQVQMQYQPPPPQQQPPYQYPQYQQGPPPHQPPFPPQLMQQQVSRPPSPPPHFQYYQHQNQHQYQHQPQYQPQPQQQHHRHSIQQQQHQYYNDPQLLPLYLHQQHQHHPHHNRHIHYNPQQPQQQQPLQPIRQVQQPQHHPHHQQQIRPPNQQRHYIHSPSEQQHNIQQR